MTIAPKPTDRTTREERDAYNLATDRDDAICVRCGRGGDCQRDHRQNRMRNNTTVENLQLLCATCHQWKTENPDAANRTGYGVPRWAKPAEYPARRWVPTTVGTKTLAWVLYVPDVDYFSYPYGYREITQLEAADRMAGIWEGVLA